MSIELGMDTITYEKINIRILENFLQMCEDACDIARVVDLFDRMDDFNYLLMKCHSNARGSWTFSPSKRKSQIAAIIIEGRQ